MPEIRNASPTLITEARVGARPSAREFNRIAQHVNRQNSGVDPAQQLASPLEAAGFFIQRFRIKSIEGNFLVCVTWNGSTEGANSISVARAYLLRRAITLHNGISFTYSSNVRRTATSGSDSETQVIVPAFAVDDQIFAFRQPRGGTGVVDNAGKAVIWQDLNLDARAWAKEAT